MLTLLATILEVGERGKGKRKTAVILGRSVIKWKLTSLNF